MELIGDARVISYVIFIYFKHNQRKAFLISSLSSFSWILGEPEAGEALWGLEMQPNPVLLMDPSFFNSSRIYVNRILYQLDSVLHVVPWSIVPVVILVPGELGILVLFQNLLQMGVWERSNLFQSHQSDILNKESSTLILFSLLKSMRS